MICVPSPRWVMAPVPVISPLKEKVFPSLEASSRPQVERAVLLLLVEPFQCDCGAVLQAQAAAPQMEQHVFAQVSVRLQNQVAIVQFQGAGAGDACVERQV